MRRLGSFVFAAALAWGAPALAQAPLAFSTDGGDAWSFEKRVEGTVQGACAELVVAAPGGTVPAWREGDRFGALAELREGENRVRAICRRDGRERAVAEQRWTLRLREGPKARARVAVANGRIALDAGASAPSPTDGAPLRRYEWKGRPPFAFAAVDERVELAAPPADGEYFVTLRATDALGRADESVVVFRVAQGAPRALDVMREPPSWMAGAAVYGVAPHFFPGGFAGIAARLDEIAALGATALWLSPVTAAADGDFGYAVADHFALNPRFGTEAEFRALIAAAHARGLRVLIDFVPNHAADAHPYHLDAERRGRRSPYWNFFDRSADGEPGHYFDWDHLNNLNFDDPEVQTLMLEAFARWLRDFGVDGFRVDVAWGVRERAPEFWPRWRAELKRIEPDLLLLAEAGARDSWYVEHGFDAAYDWTEKLGEWAWRRAFDDPARTAGHLRAALAAEPRPERTFRFLNNNDTGPRFLTRYGLGATRVAAALLLTLPGLPLVYMGDEVGAAFEPYDEGPSLQWADPHGLRDWYARLIRLRRAEPALHGPGFQLLETSRPDEVLAYRRTDPAGRDLVVLLNFAPEPATVDLSRFASGALNDLLTGQAFAADRKISVAAYGVGVLAPK